MPPKEKSMGVISARRMGMSNDVKFFPWDVDLKAPVWGSGCPKTAAIDHYFSDTSKVFKAASDTLRFRMHRGFCKYVEEVLPRPFLEIRIVREEVDEDADEDYEDPNPVIVLEERLHLPGGDNILDANATFEDMLHLMSEEWDEDEALLLCTPFKNDFHGETKFRYTIKLGWQEPANIVKTCTTTLMEKLFGDESSKDLTILAGNEAEVKCHTLIFSAHTPAFSAMLSARMGMKEAQSKRVEMRENSEEGIRLLIQYLYGLDLDISDLASDVALELFQTAHKYGLSQLESSLLDLFLEQENVWFTLDVILEMYFYVRNLDVFEELKEHALFLMASMPRAELRTCEVFKRLAKTEAVEVFKERLDYMNKHELHKRIGSPAQMEFEQAKRLKILLVRCDSGLPGGK